MTSKKIREMALHEATTTSSDSYHERGVFSEEKKRQSSEPSAQINAISKKADRRRPDNKEREMELLLEEDDQG